MEKTQILSQAALGMIFFAAKSFIQLLGQLAPDELLQTF